MSKRSIWSSVKNKINLDRNLLKAEQALRVGSEAADILVHLSNGINAPGVAALGLRVVDSTIYARQKTPEQALNEKYTPLFLYGLYEQAWKSVQNQFSNMERVPGVTVPTFKMIIHGIEFVWEFSNLDRRSEKDHLSSTPTACWHGKSSSMEESSQAIGRCIWANIESSKAYVRSSDKKISLVPDMKGEVFGSELANDLSDRITNFKQAGYNRSLLLIGEPGTGKSCIAKYIAEKQGGFCIRIPLASLRKLDPGHLVGIAKIMRPDIMIIDDLDRILFEDGESSYSYDTRKRQYSSKQSSDMLDPLEHLNNTVPLFLATANFTEGVCQAALRPQRFDEWIIVEELDKGIYESLLPDCPKNLLSLIKKSKLPVSYLVEIKKRANTLGYKKALNEVRGLAYRADKVIKLTKRKTKKRRGSPAWSLSGKTDLQKSKIREKRATKLDKMVSKALEDIEKYKSAAEKHRALAKLERDRAEAKPQKVKVVKKSKKSSFSSGKSSGKVASKSNKITKRKKGSSKAKIASVEN